MPTTTFAYPCNSVRYGYQSFGTLIISLRLARAVTWFLCGGKRWNDQQALLFALCLQLTG